jgi:hypothetical protein
MKKNILHNCGSRIRVSLIIYFITLIPLLGQESINYSGAEAFGTGGQVSYTVGQVAYTTISGNGGSVAQGVQQTYAISPVNTEVPVFGAKIKLYPNPAKDHLILHIQSPNQDVWSYELFDLSGVIVLNGITQSGDNTILTESLPAGNYIMQVKSINYTHNQSFKVLKIK